MISADAGTVATTADWQHRPVTRQAARVKVSTSPTCATVFSLEPVLAAEVRSPGFLAMAPDGLLFAPNSLPLSVHARGGQLSRGRGRLRSCRSDTADAGGPGSPATSASPPGGGCVFVANYTGGSVASFHASAKDGALQQRVVHPVPALRSRPGRQPAGQEPLPTASTVAPGGNFLLVNDLGLDRIHIFRLDHATAQLLPHTPSHWASAPGAGPRHTVCHPNGVWIYCINEVNCTVNQLLWNAAEGTLDHARHHRHAARRADTAHEPARVRTRLLEGPALSLRQQSRVSETFVVYALDPADRRA